MTHSSSRHGRAIDVLVEGQMSYKPNPKKKPAKTTLKYSTYDAFIVLYDPAKLKGAPFENLCTPAFAAAGVKPAKETTMMMTVVSDSATPDICSPNHFVSV
jgi:hypothetical protein